jgi:hypothetical protein
VGLSPAEVLTTDFTDFHRFFKGSGNSARVERVLAFRAWPAGTPNPKKDLICENR